MLISQTIDDALVEIAVKNPIDEATPQDHEYGLRTLNRIIDLYNTDGLVITYLQDIQYNEPTVNNECETADPEDLVETAWKNVITIGHCEDFNEVAPIQVQGAYFRQDDTDYTLKEMAVSDWTDIGYKFATGIPSRYHLQRMDNNSLKISFDKIPQENLELHLMAKMPYTGKNSTGNEYLPTDDINWTYGFEKMLMCRLAIELAPSYGIQPSPVLISKAQDAETLVKRKNHVPLTLKTSLKRRDTGRSDFSRSNRARY